MKVSVVIINYNTFTLTCNCIESIIDKTVGFPYEIIVVDNASTETDPQEFKKRFSQITVIQSDKNLGFAAGNNRGIAQAQGEYILLLNSDTVLMNDAVSICGNFLNRHANVAAVSARLEYPDGMVQHNCQRFPSIGYKLFEFFRLQKLLPKQIAGKVLFGFFFNYDSVAYPDWVWGTFFMFRKNLLQKLPQQKLADTFFMYVEDMQWCKEFRKLGYRIGFEPTAKVRHYMGGSGSSRNKLIDRHIGQFMDMYYSPVAKRLITWLDKMLIK